MPESVEMPRAGQHHHPSRLFEQRPGPPDVVEVFVGEEMGLLI